MDNDNSCEVFEVWVEGVCKMLKLGILEFRKWTGMRQTIGLEKRWLTSARKAVESRNVGGLRQNTRKQIANTHQKQQNAIVRQVSDPSIEDIALIYRLDLQATELVVLASPLASALCLCKNQYAQESGVVRRCCDSYSGSS